MVASVTAICNIALSYIGKGTINDENEASAEAETCRMHFASTRDIALQAYPWSWALKVESMAEVANTWPERFEYAYRRPADCLKALRIVPAIDVRNSGFSIDYAIRGQFIFCSVSPASLEFIAKMDDPTKYPPMFKEALAWALAVKIGISLTKDQALRKDAYQMAQTAMEAAKVADANEEPTMWSDYSELLASRL